MAIYNFSEHEEKQFTQEKVEDQVKPSPTKDRVFSSLSARFFFVLLLIANFLWGIYNVFFFMPLLVLNLFTFNKFQKLKKVLAKRWLNIKRFCVCAISLFVAIFTPALGIMFACTYFLMYDKAGIEEVVPGVIREQFKEFFQS